MRRNIFIALIEWMAVVSMAAAQAPDTLWTRVFGGDGDEHGYSVKQTEDQGFIISGYTTPWGSINKDVYLIKTDSSGNALWTRTYGQELRDVGHCVLQTRDEGYAVAGFCNNSVLGLDGEVLLLKTNSQGRLLWTRRFGGEGYEMSYCVEQTLDGGFILTGTTNSMGFGHDAFLIKTDGWGYMEWWRTYGGAEYDRGSAVKQTSDGGYVVAGETRSFNDCSDFYLVKTDRYGNEEWSHTYGGGDTWDYGYDVEQTYDGGYIVVGSTFILGANHSVYAVKTDDRGRLQWSNVYGGIGMDQGLSVEVTKDLGYVICGYIGYPTSGCHDVYVVKTDIQGDTLWTKTIGGAYYDWGECIQVTQDGGYIITGRTELIPCSGQVWLIRLEPDGCHEDNICHDNRYLAKTALDELNVFEASPNPFNPATKIRFTLPEVSNVNLSIYDLSSRQVASLVDGWREAGHHEITFNGSDLASGVYIYRLKAGNFTASGKMVLIK